MIVSLSLSNFIIVSKQSLTFKKGFTVLTGETGAGKSIILDALEALLGQRLGGNILRDPKLPAFLSMELEATPALAQQLGDLGLLDATEPRRVSLRRVFDVDGKSRAFINDQSVTLAALKEISPLIFHIHSQFEGMLSAPVQQKLVENFGSLNLQPLQKLYHDWKDAQKACVILEASMAKAEAEQAYWAQSLEEIQALGIQENEEALLLEKRAFLKNQETLMTALEQSLDAVAGEESLGKKIATLSKALARLPEDMQGLLSVVDQMADLKEQLQQQLEEQYRKAKDWGTESLDDVEQRLFQVRAVARKHQVQVDALPALAQDFQDKISQFQSEGQALGHAQKATVDAFHHYSQEAEAIALQRKTAGEALLQAVSSELPALRLEKTQLQLHQEFLPQGQWGEGGLDHVEFYIQTNPGSPFVPLKAAASGGEMSRILLAIKAQTARIQEAPTMIFDEIDKGVGGRAASAIGDCLKRLSQSRQVIVITHAPQVAACGDFHVRIEKQQADTATDVTFVDLETDLQRQEEIARMLSGSVITPEARLAANQLLKESL